MRVPLKYRLAPLRLARWRTSPFSLDRIDGNLPRVQTKRRRAINFQFLVAEAAGPQNHVARSVTFPVDFERFDRNRQRRQPQFGAVERADSGFKVINQIVAKRGFAEGLALRSRGQTARLQLFALHDALALELHGSARLQLLAHRIEPNLLCQNKTGRALKAHGTFGRPFGCNRRALIRNARRLQTRWSGRVNRWRANRGRAV